MAGRSAASDRLIEPRSVALNTTYKWQFVGSTTVSPGTSGTKTVYVARKLTIAATDATLTAAQQLKVHGREDPAHAGSAVTVWRHNASGTFKVGATTVKSDGTWALAHDFPKGKWSVYATAPKDATHIASKSPAITVSSA